MAAAAAAVPGLPAGAVVTPISGLPPGATVTPLQQPAQTGPQAVPAAPKPAQDAQAAGLTANPNGEGTYPMKSPAGLTVPVTYSNVHRALDQGHLFADQPSLQRYARDHAADPLDEDRVDRYLDQHPYIAAPVNAGKGLGIGLAKTLTGLDRTPATRAETDLQVLAATPTKGVTQEGGEAAENLAEFFSGDELMSMLGKAGTALGVTDKLKAMTGIAQTIEKYPVIGKLLKIGSSAAKQGTIAGGQTFAKTGDAGAAATAGGLTAAGEPVLDALGGAAAGVKAMRAGAPMVEKTVAGVKVPVSEEAAGAAATPTAQKSSEAYGQLARDAIKPHLDALNTAPQLAADVLATTHDLTGAADRMQEKVLDPLYSQLDDAMKESTGTSFRKLNSEVQQARKAARRGGNDEQGAYIEKLNEMEDMLSRTEGGFTPEQLQKIKAAWTQSYVLDDLGDLWDKNLNGAPGASQVSQEQRGLNGNGLMADIQRAIKTHGRDRIETALGPGRLENFEDIARWNQTNAKRKAFNIGLREVAANLPGHVTAGAVVGAAAHAAGVDWPYGVAAGSVGYAATVRALNAIKMNPQIGKNFMFALESGATAKRYGPFIATMIQNQQTQAARERVANEAGDGEQGTGNGAQQ